MQSAIEYAAIPTINLTPLFLVTNPLTNSSQSDTLNDLANIFYIGILSGNLGVHIGVYQPCPQTHSCRYVRTYWPERQSGN